MTTTYNAQGEGSDGSQLEHGKLYRARFMGCESDGSKPHTEYHTYKAVKNGLLFSMWRTDVQWYHVLHFFEFQALDYQVTFTPAMGQDLEPFVREFETHAEAEAALDMLLKYTTHLHENKLMYDFPHEGRVYKIEGIVLVELDGDGNPL
ncbi:MAG: hypothetical protein COA47_10280 [Robiginitomaculum sp.]|nr:MAG: hypothetical protein COA47_10280 [Robiginitomaculum sp.]